MELGEFFKNFNYSVDLSKKQSFVHIKQIYLYFVVVFREIV